MLTYCLKCKVNTENVGSKKLKIVNGTTILSLKYAVYGNKKITIYEKTRSKRIIK